MSQSWLTGDHCLDAPFVALAKMVVLAEDDKHKTRQKTDAVTTMPSSFRVAAISMSPLTAATNT